ncbi:ORF246 [White spot syndrome virus]|uniref:ORF246 n=2 Tax=White spot syndrome virus TaxID=342409 RepID=A0A2D3I6N0_9VIRU|nr:ORF246 [White spot syndrome virus]
MTLGRPSGPPSKLERPRKIFKKFLRWRMSKISSLKGRSEEAMTVLGARPLQKRLFQKCVLRFLDTPFLE